MTTKADISPGNWAALVSAGPAIARAVSASAGSAGSSETELGAYVQFVSDASIEASDESVLGRLVADVANLLAVGVDPISGDAYSEGIEQARRAGAIIAVELSRRRPPPSAAGISPGRAALRRPRARAGSSGSVRPT